MRLESARARRCSAHRDVYKSRPRLEPLSPRSSVRAFIYIYEEGDDDSSRSRAPREAAASDRFAINPLAESSQVYICVYARECTLASELV